MNVREQIENKEVKYVMKHEVEKEMFEIEVGDKTVVITEDHCMIVFRDGVGLISVAARNLMSTDKVFHSNYMKLEKTSNFTVRSLGKKKITVYDIEVEDNHNFFTNGILVHNSVYLELDGVVKQHFGQVLPPNEEIVDFLDDLIKSKIAPFIEAGYEELADYMNAYENKMVMEREGIFSAGFWTAKKRYALMTYDMEGVRYAKPKLKIMGLETQKSSTPKPARDALKKMITTMLESGETATQSFISECRKVFRQLPVGIIAVPRGVNGLEKYSIVDGKASKGTPAHARAALVYNMLIKRHKLPLDPIRSGDKLKFIALKRPNPCGFDIVGFPSHLGLPEEFGLNEYVDKDMVFEKSFIKPAETMLGAVGWNVEKTNNLEDFF